MKKITYVVMAGLMALVMGGNAAVADVTSLRGASELNAQANEISKMKQAKKKGGFERSFKQQPPMIPHAIDKDKVTIKVNTCMKCHSAANYEKEKAPKIGDSHFISRDGKTLNTASKRRWFCSQCHAPQVQADPLVENTF